MQAWSTSDIGKKRQENQDNVFLWLSYDKVLAVCIVCDGMGGSNAGSEASRIAIEVFSDEILRGIHSDMESEEINTLAVKASVAANSAVYNKSQTETSCMGMGTTLTAAIISGKTVVIVNIGDSRTYKINDKITQITQDHSLAAEFYRSGKINKEQYDNFPGKNIITRAVGTDTETIPDLFEIEFSEGEILLLCSDGLTNMLKDEEILSLASSSEDLSEACGNMINEANKAGGKDNISVILLKR